MKTWIVTLLVVTLVMQPQVEQARMMVAIKGSLAEVHSTNPFSNIVSSTLPSGS